MHDLHFVLVHGLAHRGWHLHFLQEELQRAGYTCSTLNLPAAGDTSDDHDTGGLTADAAAVREAIEQAARTHDKIVPVFHSYGGVCGSEGIAQLSPESKAKIHHLVYLAAVILPAGSSVNSYFGGRRAAWTANSENGKTTYVPDPIPVFYHDLEPPALAEEAAARLVVHAGSSFKEATKHGGWRLFPKKTYVHCLDDRALPMETQRGFFEKMSENERAGWQFAEMEGSHSPYLTKPAETAKLLEKIAGKNITVLRSKL
ncbi:Hypothetical predicted protein [Lecanosticta acicola]|uniref:AB hydrolase-1 domain-containing protein n=1 Tax=Lecanosticta acicola TaxID=111012 RepID=A0AAI9E9A5_9PEZI|nr:Hypothetical predicted protein [Lecanosticta acicola]